MKIPVFALLVAAFGGMAPPSPAEESSAGLYQGTMLEAWITDSRGANRYSYPGNRVGPDRYCPDDGGACNPARTLRAIREAMGHPMEQMKSTEGCNPRHQRTVLALDGTVTLGTLRECVYTFNPHPAVKELIQTFLFGPK